MPGAMSRGYAEFEFKVQRLDQDLKTSVAIACSSWLALTVKRQLVNGRRHLPPLPQC